MEENEDLRKKYLQLKQEINYHNYRYHVLDDPEISDEAFDKLLVELRKIEEMHPEWITPDSPTQRAGSAVSEKFEKVTHPVQVLSLANAFNKQDVINWLDRTEKMDPRVKYADFVLEPKIDGLTVVLTYQNGLLIRGATRGDGVIGEDVTPNIRTIKSVPLAIPVSEKSVKVPETIVVRGEVFILESDFEKINAELAKRGEKTWVNPRNTAAGSLRQLNPEITAQRPLRIFTYQILFSSADQPIPDTQWGTLEYLQQLGFPVSPDSRYCENREQMLNHLDEWQEIRNRLDYEIDGVVIKINDLRIAGSLGFVGKDPRGAIALKFPAREATTKLLDIGVNVGRTGVITPYAILSPVEIGGVVVKQATLHNFDFIRDRDIRIGDTVMIKRAGDVIPYVIGPLTEKRDGTQVPYVMPDRCPSCGQPLEHLENEVAVYCVNNACPAQLVRNVEHFASREAMDINGLGIKIVEQIVQNGLIKDVGDLYSLKKEDLLSLEGFGDKKAENLITAIENSKKQPLSRLINALGIRGVGEVMAITLAEHFPSLDQLKNATADDLMQIEGIGPNVAQAILDWFSRETNQMVLKKLQNAGVWPVNMKSAESDKAPQVLAGKTIVVTGTLSHFTRDEIKDFILKHGGKPVESVSNKTSFVIVGENPGSKRDKAIELGIPLYTEQMFLDMVGIEKNGQRTID